MSLAQRGLGIGMSWRVVGCLYRNTGNALVALNQGSLLFTMPMYNSCLSHALRGLTQVTQKIDTERISCGAWSAAVVFRSDFCLNFHKCCFVAKIRQRVSDLVCARMFLTSVDVQGGPSSL